jgi:pyruvate dehydrogenase E2 component (dihydrolipoyllysine-residue acetyltransferase)
MAVDVTMPRLSDSMEEGVILTWLVEPGAEVRRGEPLAEIETDKATMVYEADADGVLLEVVVEAGESAPLGAVIARIGAPGEAPTAAPASRPASAAATVVEAGANGHGAGGAATALAAPPAPSSANGGAPRAKASPVARRLAAALGIDLAPIAGSGPRGRIVKFDVLGAASSDAPAVVGAPTVVPSPAPAPAPVPAPPPAPADPAPASPVDGAKGAVEVVEPSRLQQVVARRMAESKATAPEFALHVEIDMTEAIGLRARLKEVLDPAPSFNDMVVKAVALALREHPRANGSYRDGHFELHARVNVGIAVATDDALVVPTVFDADQKSLGAIAGATRALAGKVRDGSVTPPDLAGGTFTVSNLGMYGIDSFVAVINPPQAGILAVGALRKKAVVDDAGNVVARDTMGATLVSDHRILYGAQSAVFLGRIKDILERPLLLAL